MPNQTNSTASSSSNAITTSEGNQHYVSGRLKDGTDFRSPLVKLSPHRVVFEIFHAPSEFRTSLVLSDFKIVVDEQMVYQGRAVISSLINLGTGTVCEATLDDAWVDPTAQLASLREVGGRSAFGRFLDQWRKYYLVRPEFKVVVADMQTFLTDLRLWLDQVEIGIRSSSGGAVGMDEAVAAELGEFTTPALTSLFEKFEATLTGLDEDQPAVYRSFGKRQLHSLLLCSPFLYRTYTKPLGYAGDYEMVNMICGNPFQGGTLFAKVLNLWFLKQAPAEAHRNRIQYLVDQIEETALDAARAGRIARITSVGCGPAQEVQRFIQESDLADRVCFRLVDFNEETVNYTAALLQRLKQQHHRRTQIEVVRKSVHQILKEAGRNTATSPEGCFDLAYCAGLFDYLTDQTCRRLTNILFSSVSPGGRFISTNVDASNPRRLTMDYLMDWHLIYRTAAQLQALRPDSLGREDGVTSSDYTGVNIYYAARRPARG